MKVSKSYSNEIKLLATERVLIKGERVTEVAKDLRIAQSTLYTWISASKQDSNSENGVSVETLKQRLKKVSEERDILIKAASILAKQLY
ncbi:Transposase IS3/IS911 family protein [Pseudoalteromonas phenolica]|uniref:Transposase IS3/IS911 family protein n=1 Tax=Pseudoalteromonas phenolica TaxID=161398 RepID=A0A0S2K190_9GAMM|nr:Transposase IS3/IS911 family protein [Pseudoalteromonas phenolica]MBE0353620.1 hypothetical protein [Pseudoalteromonas phenolica O-BC30]